VQRRRSPSGTLLTALYFDESPRRAGRSKWRARLLSSRLRLSRTRGSEQPGTISLQCPPTPCAVHGPACPNMMIRAVADSSAIGKQESSLPRLTQQTSRMRAERAQRPCCSKAGRSPRKPPHSRPISCNAFRVAGDLGLAHVSRRSARQHRSRGLGADGSFSSVIALCRRHVRTDHGAPTTDQIFDRR
jgi:hypothetical protein